MPTVILDTDFLSSFLKIERCYLVQTLYQVEQALIPIAVHRELARTDLLQKLLAVRWIKVSETVVNIPAFLLACKMSNLIGPEQMMRIIQDLNDRDYYRFKAGVRDLLLG